MMLLIFQCILFVIQTAAYENLAIRKPAWQQHDWPYTPNDWGAAKAVDGRYTNRSASANQCTISSLGQTTATWRVDLGSALSISHIDIYYRTDSIPSPGAFYGRFAGFFLYVSNTTSKDDGHLCFHEIQNVNGTPVENQTISCSVHGRYVIYYNERRLGVTYPDYYWHEAYNELCEVEVYGCADSKYYGENCDKLCPDKCQGKRCDVITGRCLGCTPGYQGPDCNQECDVQTYGSECSLPCGNCSDGGVCHHVSGTCPRGCDEGVYGEKCQTQCQPGFYGKNCGHRCSENCNVTNRCNRFTGECGGGCEPGWTLPTCQHECDGGMYGPACTQRCGPCLDNEQCHHINGTCLNGCSSGYQGGNCEENCPSGYFGINCENSCTVYCGRNGSCDRTTGICDGGCREGWSGPLCGTEEKPISRATCTADDNTVFIVGLVISVFVVIAGSAVNFLIWKRNQTKYKQRGLKENFESQPGAVHVSDITSSADRVGSPYAELGDKDKSNMYDELHHYTEAAGKIN
ncbi:multiple epidermal growth factor-like domains protein 10 [Ostrea edulis]|uniref:multiple epidermal growth factor-like domains protein 10 n=1 Tax=Ostrea edulis TaxID=37623 RepID=UPI0024AE8F37|nr:multiple epidermal growth factor-like domains protein 10 [Ostrea edulis]XP_056002336.1 multiple epidermal growth factor-like domains protein 10 [Ostrea edulis]XP_056002337.1 multiple epidermal growth factor-like domains protein 10 [Ostrea edulis]XP_056002338.1 multiple epidermal growth factor-like domains protein 10 [Ostrea edulis]XP_056002339.1 multiple epidermal growth factor-like domains protein 10 [Ostrea edulis]